jgi:hypothetical protein
MGGSLSTEKNSTSAEVAGPDGPPPLETSRRGSLAWRGWLQDCFALDVRSLALFRIALALLVLGDLAIRASDLKAFYSDAGIVPRERLADGGSWSVHALGGTADYQALVFLVHAGAAVALLVGFRTGLAAFLTCFLLMSLHVRNPFVLQGGDALLRLLLFWGLFLPLGACFSLDARRGPAAPRRVLSVGSTALVLQIGFVYWFSVAFKTDPCWHEDGTAVYYALSIDQLVKPAGKLLLGYPGLMRALTHATLWFEALAPAALFVPVARWQVRTAVVAGFCAFHLIGLNLCLELGPFPYVCAAAWLALLPGPFWDRLGRWWSRVPRPAPAGLLRATPGVNVVAALFLGYVFLWNLRTTDFDRFQVLLPRQLNSLGFTFGLDQFWGMFAPGPPHDDGWYVVVGTLEGGAQVDPLRDGRPVSWEKPEWVSRLYANERWRKFMMNLCREGQADNRVRLMSYLWQEWHAAHPTGARLDRLELYYMHEETPPPGQPAEARPLLLGYRHRQRAARPDALAEDDRRP